MSAKTNKEFKLSSWAISNKSTVAVITLIVVLGGLLSYTSMPRENFPEIIVPQIYVGTPYPGNSALDVEKLITKRLEKEINSITSLGLPSALQMFFEIGVFTRRGSRRG